MAVLSKILPILILLAVIGIVIWRLPKVEIQHSKAFEARRRLNWITLGLTYAFLYFGRYNLAVAKTELDAQGLMTNEIFGTIFSIGAIVYGCSIVINAPICDKLGGRQTLMFGAAGASVANLLMGLFLVYHDSIGIDLKYAFIVLYAINMYFQSFGAVSIVKVNSAWFHVRERGMIGGIFGALISLGYYFAFDWNRIILDNLGVYFVFFIPSAVLLVMFLLTIFVIRDSPGKAGLEDINTGDATSGDTGPRMSVRQVFVKLITNPVILTIACIEFCSGYIRDGITQWGPTVSRVVPVHQDSFVFQNWGMINCCAGIMAGMLAGIISDHVFKSRRGPVAALLYGGLLLFCFVLFFVLDNFMFGVTFVCMFLCVIGVHGMLSGTASMDFGGSKNAGIATGIIDAFAYLGVATSGFLLGKFLPSTQTDGIEYVQDPGNWFIWPALLMPAIVIGLCLSLRIWNATVQKQAAKSDAEKSEEEDKSEEEKKSEEESKSEGEKKSDEESKPEEEKKSEEESKSEEEKKSDEESKSEGEKKSDEESKLPNWSTNKSQKSGKKNKKK